MGIATEDEIEYKNADWFGRACMNTGTFLTSVVYGVGSVTEGIVDGMVMIAGGVGGLCGADTKWAEDFVSISFSDEAYSGLVDSGCLNSVSAYSGWHSAGAFVGEASATVMLQFLPGGTYVMTAAHGLKGMGEASEKALNMEGVSFYQALGYGAINGTIEAVSSYVLYGKTGVGNKIADNVGKKLGGEQVMGFLKKGFGKIPFATNYANSVFKPNLISKFLIAGTKEFAKEGAGMVIGEEFKLNEAWNAAWKSMVTTAFNEFVVSPAVNKLTKNYDAHKDNVKSADEKYYESKGKAADAKKNINEIKKAEANSAKTDIKDIDETKVVDSPSGGEDLAYYQAAYNTQKQIMDSAYDSLTIWDEVIGKDFINKYIKKFGSEFMKEGVLA